MPEIITTEIRRNPPEWLIGSVALAMMGILLGGLGIRQFTAAQATTVLPSQVQSTAFANPFDQQSPSVPLTNAGGVLVGYTVIEVADGTTPQLPSLVLPTAPPTALQTTLAPATALPPGGYASGLPQQATNPQPVVPPVGAAQGQKVHLNTATQAELETLPGIGPTKAAAILQWRATNGSFSTVQELTQVKGIGDKTLQKLLPYIEL